MALSYKLLGIIYIFLNLPSVLVCMQGAVNPASPASCPLDLIAAVQEENQPLIDMLLSRRSNPNVTLPDGSSLLMSNARQGKIGIVRKLQSAGARIKLFEAIECIRLCDPTVQEIPLSGLELMLNGSLEPDPSSAIATAFDQKFPSLQELGALYIWKNPELFKFGLNNTIIYNHLTQPLPQELYMKVMYAPCAHSYCDTIGKVLAARITSGCYAPEIALEMCSRVTPAVYLNLIKDVAALLNSKEPMPLYTALIKNQPHTGSKLGIFLYHAINHRSRTQSGHIANLIATAVNQHQKKCHFSPELTEPGKIKAADAMLCGIVETACNERLAQYAENSVVYHTVKTILSILGVRHAKPAALEEICRTITLTQVLGIRPSQDKE